MITPRLADRRFLNLMNNRFLHRYPQCLHFLELLQYEHFRRELVNPACAKFIDEQQILHWQYYSRRRMRISLPKSSGQTGPASETEPSWTIHYIFCRINAYLKSLYHSVNMIKALNCYPGLLFNKFGMRMSIYVQNAGYLSSIQNRYPEIYVGCQVSPEIWQFADYAHFF